MTAKPAGVAVSDQPAAKDTEAVYLTTPTTARLLGLSVPTVRRLIIAGELPGRKLGNKYLVHRSAIEVPAPPTQERQE